MKTAITANPVNPDENLVHPVKVFVVLRVASWTKHFLEIYSVRGRFESCRWPIVRFQPTRFGNTARLRPDAIAEKPSNQIP